MNRRRSIYNITLGLFSQLLSISLGIIIPRLFLVNYGSEVNGFLNSISQIIAYFGLLEAGIGAASLQALYGPVAKNDEDSISSVLAATDRYYRKTGIIYAICVLILSFLYPFVVKSDIPKWAMILIILFNGIPGVISYCFQAKYFLLFSAEGKNYIGTILNTISSTLVSISKIILIVRGCNIVLIQLSYLVINLLKVVFISVYIKRKYTWVNLHIKPNYGAISQKNSAFINQICDLIFRNTDTIILTLFCNLKVVSVYAMYTLLFSMVRTALDYVSQGFAFVMGQTYNRDIKYFEKLHDTYEAYRMALVFALFTVAYVFILPFMRLYTADVNDIDYIDEFAALLFTIYYLLTGSRACASDLINYAQHFQLTQGRCITEAVINLTVSIIAAQYWGIYGVLLGTIVALIYRVNDMFIYSNRRILKRSPWPSYKRLLSNFVVFIITVLIAKSIPWQLDSYLAIIGWAVISGIVICAIYFVVASATNHEEYEMLKSFTQPIIKRLMKKFGHVER